MRARLALVLVLAACGGEPMGAVTPPPAPAQRQPAGPILPEYLPNPDVARTQVFSSGDETWLMGVGLRAAFRKGGSPVVVAGPNLVGGRPLPASMGGGAVFWGGRVLHRAERFDGPLRGLRSFANPIASVAAHPEGLVVGTGAQQLLVDRETGLPKRMSPLGLEQVVVTTDGRALARLALGDVARWEGGAWSPLALPAGEAAAGLNVQPLARGGEEVLVSATSRTFVVDPAGQLKETARAGAPTPRLGVDTSWTSSSTPLAAAVLRGVPRDGKTAAVLGPGGLFLVNLLDGQATLEKKDVVPARASCELALVQGGTSPTKEQSDDAAFAAVRAPLPDVPDAPLLGDAVLLCATPQGALVIGSLFANPTVEQKLPGPGSFFLGDDGALAYVARAPEAGKQDAPPATPPPRRGKPPPAPEVRPESRNELTVWSRTGRGVWSEHPVSSGLGLVEGRPPPTDDAPEVSPDPDQRSPSDPQAEAPGEDPAFFVRPLPSQAGTTLLFRRGRALFHVDVARGVATQVLLSASGVRSDPLHDRLSRITPPSPGSLVIDHHVSARPGGGFAGLWEDAAFEVDRDGVARERSESFQRAAVSGPRGLGRRRGALYQTVDRGRHWVPVANAPSESYELRCGTVGCWVSHQLRLGWRATPVPTEQKLQESVAPAELADRVPSLSCLPSARATRKAAPRGGPAGEPVLGLGATKLAEVMPDDGAVWMASRWSSERQSDASPLALLFSRAPPYAPNGALDLKNLRDRVIHTVDPFDPAGTIRRGTQKLGPLYGLYASRQLDLSLAGDVLGVTPILPLPPKPGMRWPAPELLFEFPLEAGTGGAVGRWNGRELAVTWDSVVDDRAQSAIAHGGSTLVLSETGRLRQHTAQGSRVLLDLPHFLVDGSDALAARPDGSVWLLRRSNAPPNTYAPALLLPLLGPGLSPRPLVTSAAIALAPWETLTLASDPKCRADTQGARVFVSSEGGWLGRGGSEDEPPAMHALVRWSSERVCLEAVELGSNGYEWAPELLVARFDEGPKDGNGAVLQIEAGLESRAPQRCVLGTP